jgi:hypothetical protein
MREPFSYAYADAAATETLVELQLVAKVSHKGEAGRAREGILRRFITRIAPPSLGLEPGFVIDGRGGVSGQVDLVLYRTDYYPVLEVGGVKHFPVESVIAVFEIKASTDSKAKLTDALEQIESVKSLDRTGRGTNYALDPMGVPVQPDAFQFQVFGAVLSERSMQASSALTAIEKFCKSRPRRNWPNLVVAAADYSVRYESPDGSPGEDPAIALGLMAAQGEQGPPLSDVAVALANIVRVAVPIDFNPSNYFPSSPAVVAHRPLPDDRFPGRQENTVSLESLRNKPR